MLDRISNRPSYDGASARKEDITTIHMEGEVDAGLDEKAAAASADLQFIEGYPDKDRRKLLWKLDLRIVTVLTTLYIMSFIDRANIGNAKVEGMLDDLGMSGSQYNVVLSIFFLTYIGFDIPSNYLLEKYLHNHPSWYIGGITLLWGIMMTMHGVTTNYGSLMAVRLLMGAFEAGLVPGAFLYMTKWYTKFELGTRFSIFYVGSALSGAFSGLLAYAFAQMDGIGGIAGWRWIFLMEGIITVIIGMVIPFVLPDTPSKRIRWLKEEERRYLTVRMTIQNGGSNAEEVGTRFSWKLLWDVVTDWQFYLMVFNYYSNNIPSYGFKFTMPTIMTNMGYSGNHAQLMTVPPYIAGAISCWVFGLLSDKFKRRAYFLLVPQALVVIGYAIITPLAPKIKENIGACYFAIVLANIGLYPISPGSSTWISNNLAGTAKRAIGLAYIATIANVGGIVSSYIFISSEAPSYPTGFGTSLAFAVMGIISTITLELNYIRINKKRDRMTEAEIREKYTNDQVATMGNKAPTFRYTL